MITMISGQEAEAQIKLFGKRKTKTELKREKDSLLVRLDSLEKLVKNLKVEDSLSQEIIKLYENPELGAIEVGQDSIAYNMEVSDSLYNIWQLQNEIALLEENNFVEDGDNFASNVPDSVYIKRIEGMNSFITLPYNSIVRNSIILYSEKRAKSMGKVLGLASYYFPYFEEIFLREGLPEELKAMAIIESSLNPTATSRVGAKGMWQFMYGTARVYKLEMNSFVDERVDPFRSAEAAAQYLKDAYKIFGDWNLAIASYNCGAGNVNKAIRRAGGSRAFWDIYPYLPRETRGYVPAFVGALYTLKYYNEHNIEPIYPELPAPVDTFKINKKLHFKQVTELTGIDLEELKSLNPQYTHGIVPGNDKEYILRIPLEYSNEYIDVEDTLYTHKEKEFFNPVLIKKIIDGADGERIIYKVKRGDVLGRIAMRYRVSVTQLKKWNNLRSNNIRIGQRLVIYWGGKGPVPTRTTSASSSSSSSTAKTYVPKPSKFDPNKYTTYTIKSGESLYLIAKKYPGISAENIMDFNKISSKIKAGMVIKIPRL